MNCVKCVTGRALVVDSRPGDQNDPRYKWLLDKGQQVWGWWNPQAFRIRKRVCSSCGHVFYTIELSVDDLGEAFQDVLEQRQSKESLKAE